MKRGKEGIREEGRPGGREERKKEGRKGGGEEGRGREGERHYEGIGNFLRRQIQASIFFKPSQTQPSTSQFAADLFTHTSSACHVAEVHSCHIVEFLLCYSLNNNWGRM